MRVDELAGGDGVAEALAPWRAHGWELLRDVHRPGRAGHLLGHVAVGPGGVLVLDVAHGGRSADPEDVAVMAASVSALLDPPHRTAVHGAIALTDRDMTAMVGGAGTVVVGRRDLDAWRDALPPRLDDDDVVDVAGRLRDVLGADDAPVQLVLGDVAPSAPLP